MPIVPLVFTLHTVRIYHWLLGAVVVGFLVVAAYLDVESVLTQRLAKPHAVPAAPPASNQTQWIGIGGGASPSLNPVSIEDDFALATRVLGPKGRLLFAGGFNTKSVQVSNDKPQSDRLMSRLAEIFSPRDGRDAHYRKTRLSVHAAATPDNVKSALSETLGSGASRILILLAGHGEQGNEPAQNQVRLWGGFPLTVSGLTKLLDAATESQRVRVVATSCFSGGFSELVFSEANSAAGPTPLDRCGLFASTWQLEASGCDPSPDRGSHQGYAIHFFNALKRQDRSGKALDNAAIDFDGNGEVSLLEAHSRVRIASGAADVPTTTSERWLRFVAPAPGEGRAVSLPEEDAVIAALAKQLGLSADMTQAVSNAESLTQAARQRSEQALEAERNTDIASYKLSAQLLSRWPVLDDPWHPDFMGTLKKSRTEIDRFLSDSPTYQTYTKALADAERLSGEAHQLHIKAAPYVRIARAMRTKALAGYLKARGGKEWDVYQKLLACERSVP